MTEVHNTTAVARAVFHENNKCYTSFTSFIQVLYILYKFS